MKKILSFLIIPALVVAIVIFTQISASSIDYDITLGNSLSSQTYSLNTYVEDGDTSLQTYDISIPSTFVKKAENDYLELYLEEDTLAIAVRVKANGYVYASYDINNSYIDSLTDAVRNPIVSGISINAYYKDGTPVTKTFLDEKTASGVTTRYAEATISDITNGFTMFVDFSDSEFKFRFEVNVTIEDGDLVVNIPASTIDEYNPNLFSNDSTVQYYLLKDIIVFPYFGSTDGETDGYDIIPDGSGMIVDLDASPTTKGTFALELYGTDLGYMSPSSTTRIQSVNSISRLTLPIFGVIHDVGNTGFFVISEEGSTYAILNYVSATVINNFHRIYFSYRYRDSYEQYQSRANEEQYRIAFQDEVNQNDVTQRYVFLTGEDASYVGVAKAYRDYLIDNNALTTPQATVYSKVPTKIDFIGTEVTMGIVSDKLVGITKYTEMKSIIEELQNDGYTELITALKTYSMSDYGYGVNLSSLMGTKAEFKDYLAYLEEQGIEFSYYLDYTRSYDSYSTEHAQTLSKRDIYWREYSAMNAYHYVNDTGFYIDYAETDLKTFTKYGITNVSIAGLDRAIYTSYDKAIQASGVNVTEIGNMLNYYEENGIKTGIYLPDAFNFKYLDEYYKAPLSSSEYNVQSAAIPLVELVLSGYVDFYSDYLNFISDESFSLLRLVEYGVYPSYILTGSSTYTLKESNSSNVYISEYDVLKDRIQIYYDFISAGLYATMGQEMINHQYIATGIVLVTYSEGTQIILNYNKTAYDYNGLTVPALGYEVIE